MLLCTISIPRVEASISRVLATSTIHKRHWGLSFTEHKRTIGRIKKGNLYLKHMEVSNHGKTRTAFYRRSLCFIFGWLG